MLSQLMSVASEFLGHDVVQNGSNSRIANLWPQLIGLAYPCLRGVPLMRQIEMLVHRVLANREHGLPQLDFIEYCSGKGMLSKALLQCGLNGCSIDLAYSSAHDMLEKEGLRFSLDALAATRLGALIWLGTQCSSFIGLCTSVSKRAIDNCFYGDESREFVAKGNMMAEISCLVCFVAILVGCHPTLEQPITSTMVKLPSFSSLFSFEQFNFRRTLTWMGAFWRRKSKTAANLALWSL